MLEISEETIKVRVSETKPIKEAISFNFPALHRNSYFPSLFVVVPLAIPEILTVAKASGSFVSLFSTVPLIRFCWDREIELISKTIKNIFITMVPFYKKIFAMLF
jgi:hypothetical protein